MTGRRGRDQREPMERLVRIAAVLHGAGERGVPVAKLAEIAHFDEESRNEQVAREIRHLNRQGWQIENIGPEGERAVYRMRSVDNRLRVGLSPTQQRELRRAALLVSRSGLADQLGLEGVDRPQEVEADIAVVVDDEALATVLTAMRLRSKLRFRYKGSERVVHPQSVTTQHGIWYLRGREEGAELVKAFVVGRMTDLTADEPGTATRGQEAAHPGLDPMTWEVDPPVEVTLRTPREFRPDVERLLGSPSAVSGDDLRYVVTNRSALRSRLYELGPRVSLVAPDDVRRELLAELASMARGT